MLRLVLKIMENVENRDTAISLVYEALAAAEEKGLKRGIKVIDATPVVVIELPTGQVSWRLPQFDGEIEEITNEEQQKRIEEYILLS